MNLVYRIGEEKLKKKRKFVVTNEKKMKKSSSLIGSSFTTFDMLMLCLYIRISISSICNTFTHKNQLNTYKKKEEKNMKKKNEMDYMLYCDAILQSHLLPEWISIFLLLLCRRISGFPKYW